MKRFSDKILERLHNNEELVVATIIEQQGSTPRTAGTKMAIFADGSCLGTVGGGLFESKVMELSGKLLAEGGSAFMSFDLTSDVISGMDMICGGHLRVFLDHLKPDRATIAVFKAWREEILAGRPGTLVTAISGEDEPYQVEHALVNAYGGLTGGDALSAETLETITTESANGPSPLKMIIRPGETLMLESTVSMKTAYIIGAGHVSMPTAHLAAMTGFRVVVLDDRREFANNNRFPEASEIRVITDYDRFMADLPVDEDSFIIIVTRGHLHDKETLAQALCTNAGYIGMIGSSKKKKAIYQALMDEGFSENDLERVHSPIGLAILAETPEEIAVSIAAEMIKVRVEMSQA